MTTVLVVAPSPAARARLAGLLAADKRLHVVTAAPGPGLSREISGTPADVIVVDLGGGLTTRPLASGASEAPGVVFLADDPRAAPDQRDRREGGWAVLPRHATAAELSAAIEAAAAGLVAVHPETAFALRAPPRSREAIAVARQPLTPRETEVLGLIADGLGNTGIAARLSISEHTVKFHIAAIFAKFDAGSRAEAVATGVRRGLILI